MLGSSAIAVLQQKVALLLLNKFYSVHLSGRTEDVKVYLHYVPALARTMDIRTRAIFTKHWHISIPLQ